MKVKLIMGAIAFSLMATVAVGAEQRVKVQLTQPELDVNPYHRPYVAVWVETPEREPIKTLAVWHEQDKWLKDLRQWWRKIGRDLQGLDGNSGATEKPGIYTIYWDGKDSKGKTLPNGEYLINIEAAREEGGRSYMRERIHLGSESEIIVAAEAEIGPVRINTYQ